MLGLRAELVGRSLGVAAAWALDPDLSDGAGIQPRIPQLMEQPIPVRNPRRLDLDVLCPAMSPDVYWSE